MAVRIATFNAENIMHRFDFSGFADATRRDRAVDMFEVGDKDHYRQLEQARAIAHIDDKMQLTALAVADCRADIVCLQEIENVEALDAFEELYLSRVSGRRYPHRYLVEGNDGRGIDVAVMTTSESREGDRIEFERLTSHSSVTFEGLGLHTPELAEAGVAADARIFRRDCLELDLRIDGRALTLFVVHFKSPGAARDGMDGRVATIPIRNAEAAAVRALIERKFGPELASRRRWLVCGDLNDFRERIVVEGSRHSGYRFTPTAEPRNGIEPLFRGGFGEDLVVRLPPMERWTLYYDGGPEFRHLCQLDYLVASPRLASRNRHAIPDILRKGQPWRTPFPPGQETERYPRIGWDRPKSSDHCPVAVTLHIV